MATPATPGVTTTAPTAPGRRRSRSTAQRSVGRRILDATLALASKGGYDAVQMRAVAEKADVAVGPCTATSRRRCTCWSRPWHARWTGRVEADRSKLQGENAVERLRHVLDLITLAMQRDPLLTEAMTRAFMFADASAATEVDAVAASSTGCSPARSPTTSRPRTT